MHEWEVQEIVTGMGLPELPEHTSDEDPEARDLILFFADLGDENIYLRERVSYQDAKDYANHPDASGDGWFVGFDRS
jgi:hypothetical protein